MIKPLTVTACTAPKWADAAHTIINCQVTFAQIGKPLDFNATASDPETHGKSLFADLVAGKYGAIAEYTPPAVAPLTSSKGVKQV